jgi:hypothetical protein
MGWRVYSRGEGGGELGEWFTAEEKEGVNWVEGLQQGRGGGEWLLGWRGYMGGGGGFEWGGGIIRQRRRGWMGWRVYSRGWGGRWMGWRDYKKVTAWEERVNIAKRLGWKGLRGYRREEDGVRLHKNKDQIETSAGLDTEVFTGEIDDGTVKS